MTSIVGNFMKDKDRMFQLSSDLISLQKEANALKVERDSLAKRVSELQEIVASLEKLLDRAVQLRRNPSNKPKS